MPLPSFSDIITKHLCTSLTVPHAYLLVAGFRDEFHHHCLTCEADTNRLQSRIVGSLHNLSRLVDTCADYAHPLSPAILPNDLKVPFKTGSVTDMLKSALQAFNSGLASTSMSEALSSAAVVKGESEQSRINQEFLDYAIYCEAMTAKLANHLYGLLPANQRKLLSANKHMFKCDCDRLERLVVATCVYTIAVAAEEEHRIDTISLRYHPDWDLIYDTMDRFMRTGGPVNIAKISMPSLARLLFVGIDPVEELLMPSISTPELKDLFGSFYDPNQLFDNISSL